MPEHVPGQCVLLVGGRFSYSLMAVALVGPPPPPTTTWPTAHAAAPSEHYTITNRRKPSVTQIEVAAARIASLACVVTPANDCAPENPARAATCSPAVAINSAAAIRAS